MKRCLFGFFAGCSLVLAAQSTAVFHGDAQHTGRYESIPPNKITQVKWEFQTGGPVISSPVVASGKVYVGSADHCLYALDVSTGKKIWAYKSGATVNGAAAVSGSTVYFLSNDGFLYAVRATDGSLSWKFQTQGESRFTAKGLDGMLPILESMPDPWDFFLSSPVVDAGLVYFGSGDGHVYAVNASTGKLAWKFATKNVVHSSPALSDGILYVGGWDAFLYALDAKTGS